MRLNRILLGIIAFLVWGTDASAGRYKHILKQYEAATTRTDFTSEMTLVGDYSQKDIKHFAQRYRSEYGEDPFVADFSYEILSHQRKWGGYRPDIVKVSFLKPKNEEQWINYWASYYEREHQRYQASTFKKWFWSVVGVGAFVALVDHFWNRNKENIELAIQKKYSKYKFEECDQPTNNPRDLYFLTIMGDVGVASEEGFKAQVEYLETIIKAQCGKEDLFGNIYVKTLKGAQATKPRIKHALKNITDKTDEDDIFFFYFIGHGSNKSGVYSFSPYNAVRFEDTLTIDEILNALDDDNGKSVFFFESCHSGAIESDLSFVNGFSSYIEKKKLKQATIFMSCSPDELSWTGETGFTEAVIDGLKGWADIRIESGNRNSIVSLKELIKYVQMQVPKRAKKIGKIQNPQVFHMVEKVETRLSSYNELDL